MKSVVEITGANILNYFLCLQEILEENYGCKTLKINPFQDFLDFPKRNSRKIRKHISSVALQICPLRPFALGWMTCRLAWQREFSCLDSIR